jgi:spore coat polysaccharide biosynthesis protein SpsF (cytidylyltransferase family)
MDIEVFSFRALERAWKEARLPSEREHVTPYIWKNPTRFNIANVRHEVDLSHLRWTLDYEEDLHFAREVYARLSHKGIFLMEDVLALLQTEPELSRINQGIERNVGYKVSLQKETSPERQ